MTVSRFAAAAIVAASLAACATPGQRQSDSERLAAYEAAAGTPVRSFRYLGPLWSWEGLGTDHIVVYTQASQAWLLDVPGCNRLPFANVIGITSNLHQVAVHFDRVLAGRDYFPCFIDRIRPVDVAKLKVLRQAPRKVEERPRPAGSAKD